MSNFPGTPEPHGAEQMSRREQEVRRVKEWERDRLIELGCDKFHAELAAEVGVDWHDVERLIARGCAPTLALDIAA